MPTIPGPPRPRPSEPSPTWPGSCTPRTDRREEAGAGTPRRRPHRRALVEAGADVVELGRDVGPEGLHGDQSDHGDEGQKQAVLHHAGATLAVGVELGLEPGLENEEIHCSSSRGAPEAPASPLIW